jgi:hypothetical protein
MSDEVARLVDQREARARTRPAHLRRERAAGRLHQPAMLERLEDGFGRRRRREAANDLAHRSVRGARRRRRLSGGDGGGYVDLVLHDLAHRIQLWAVGSGGVSGGDDGSHDGTG